MNNVPFTYEGGISAFIKSEVYPYAPDAYVDEKQTKIGYELSFNKYFLVFLISRESRREHKRM